jgi:putative nucleotidyltransferase with HDIG domain
MDSKINIDQFINEVTEAIESDHLILPSPPDVVLRVSKLLDDPDSNPNELVKTISADAALAARILKVTNSVNFNRGTQIESLQQAVMRLGLKLIKILVTNHAMMQIFFQPSGNAAKLISQIYQHSIEVARLAYAITADINYLSTDDAMLSGLVHDIGYLPLLQVLAKYGEININDKAIQAIMIQEHPALGRKLLEKWNFPKNIIHVAEQHEQIERSDTGNADLTDVIIVAEHILSNEKNDFEPHKSDQENLMSYIRLGLTSSCSLEDFSEGIEAAKQILPAA